jgi:predicted TIM-barrel fold metal-dependent hydrolase
MLRTRSSSITRAKFPVVDVHTHFAIRAREDRTTLKDYVALMDRQQIAICASLDARLGSTLQRHCDFLWNDYPDRFVVFANIDFQGSGKADQRDTWACNQPGFAKWVAEELERAAASGISGLKFFKEFGLRHRDANGELLKIDDPQWDPIWEACGRLRLPVLIHVADPEAFFLPIDATNERYEELSRHPDWSFAGKDFPSHQALLEAFLRVVERHRTTNFIAAHVANSPEDLSRVSGWLDEHPNLHVEIASRISELGRQPYTARKFFIRHADRILFGTDGPWPEARVMLYWRFLETEDEYFPYSEKSVPPQGLWQIYGVHLPDDVLRKVYSENAARLIPGVQSKLDRFQRP